jgi:hypothetical protein
MRPHCMTTCRPRFPNPGKVAAGDIKLVNGRKVIVHGSAIAAGKRDTMILPKWACGVLASPDKPMASGHARHVDPACSARLRRPGRGHGCGRARAIGLFATQSQTSCRLVLRLKQESRSTDAAAFVCVWPGHRRPVRKTRPGKGIRLAGRQAAHSAPNTTATTRANAAAMANRSIVDVQAIVTSVG